MLRLMLRAAALISLFASAGLVFGASTSSASAPSGQVMYGNTSFTQATMTFVGGGGTIEPAYNDANGTLVYLSTPNHAVVHPHGTAPHNVAPLYLVVYPVGSGIAPTTLNCEHMTTGGAVADNCPDHGFLVAGAAMTIEPTVYGAGVLGHDHLVGIASTGGDFNVVWEPVLVLFTSVTAATQHMTTLTALQTAAASTQVIEIPLPQLDFHCSRVSAAAYARGTPSPVIGES